MIVIILYTILVLNIMAFFNKWHLKRTLDGFGQAIIANLSQITISWSLK